MLKICQFVRIIECCDQSVDRGFKKNKKYHICSILSTNVILLKVGKIWDSVSQGSPTGLKVRKKMGKNGTLYIHECNKNDEVLLL